jgi:2-methylisocitrate lyase-like PEP mutase family enzyme
VLADAIERGRAFLDAGASCVFVPGRLDEATVTALVEGIGERKVSVINVPGSLSQARLQELGVARVSYGPWIQRAALTYLADLTTDILGGANLPEGVRPLN